MMLGGEGGQMGGGFGGRPRGRHWEEADVEEGSPGKQPEPSGTGGQDKDVGWGQEARGCRGGRVKGLPGGQRSWEQRLQAEHRQQQDLRQRALRLLWGWAA